MKGAAAVAALGCAPSAMTRAADASADGELDWFQRETDLVTPETYAQYTRSGDTQGFAALEKLEQAFEKVFREARQTIVADVPAVWCVYNMGFIVKTRESLFSIDLVHRRGAEFAPYLDFALITHNHGDHWRQDFYQAMNSSGKTVISNFLDNYGVANWKETGGYTRAKKIFRIKDVEIRTSLVDHNDYLIDYTTAFEIRVGKWTLYHTGDCGRGSEGKLLAGRDRPDLWLFFPGCGIDVEKAVKRVRPKRVVLGHLWELAHPKWRLSTSMVREGRNHAVSAGCGDVSFALWGLKVS